MIDDNNNLCDYIDAQFRSAHSHRERLLASVHHLSPKFPLTEEGFHTLIDEDIFYLDSLILRFSKLQDLLGTKLFKTILSFVHQSNSDHLTLIDQLNLYEKFGIIHIQDWKKLRAIRNHITHDYPDTPLLTILHLNEAYESIPLLIKIFNNLEQFYNDQKAKQ